jgi:hypothetical protein
VEIMAEAVVLSTEEILFVHVTVDCGKLHVVCGSEGFLDVEENVQKV